MWDQPANDTLIQKVIEALKTNGIHAMVVENGEAAKQKVLEIIPQGIEVLTMSSVTVDTIGLGQEINESGKFNSVRKTLTRMDRNTQGLAMQKLGAGPDWAVGSVHAVTEDGHVMIASNTGSQLAAYAYGASHVLWVVGTQKIVKNVEEGMKRIYEYSLPLESERAHKAYGVAGSAVNKVLIINKEIQAGRLTVIFIKEKIGF